MIPESIHGEGGAMGWHAKRGYDVSVILKDIHGPKLTPSTPEHDPVPCNELLSYLSKSCE
jgi:hypothetical protein